MILIIIFKKVWELRMNLIIAIIVSIIFHFYAVMMPQKFMVGASCFEGGVSFDAHYFCAIPRSHIEQSMPVYNKAFCFAHELRTFRRKMVTKSSKLCRKVIKMLSRRESGDLLRQISTESGLSEYLSVSSGERPVLIHLVPSDNK